jgi:hypothetical protein
MCLYIKTEKVVHKIFNPLLVMIIEDQAQLTHYSTLHLTLHPDFATDFTWQSSKFVEDPTVSLKSLDI